MSKKDKAPQNLYIASYTASDVAEKDWNSLQQLTADKVMKFDALELVNRDDAGKIHVKDTKHQKRAGAAIGAVGGALVGLIFPPSLLASAAVGAGIGTGTGAMVSRATKRKVEADVEWILPPGGWGIVAIFDPQEASEVEKVLANANRISRDQLESDDDEDEEKDPNAPSYE